MTSYSIVSGCALEWKSKATRLSDGFLCFAREMSEIECPFHHEGVPPSLAIVKVGSSLYLHVAAKIHAGRSLEDVLRYNRFTALLHYYTDISTRCFIQIHPIFLSGKQQVLPEASAAFCLCTVVMCEPLAISYAAHFWTGSKN